MIDSLSPQAQMKQRVNQLADEMRVLDKLIPEYEKKDWLLAGTARLKYIKLDKECIELLMYLKTLEE